MPAGPPTNDQAIEALRVTQWRVSRGPRRTTPRLTDAVARLTREHAEINDLIDQLLNRVGAAPVNDDVDAVRDLGTALLLRLIRSRQRSADLIYQAYHSDIGGEA